MRLATFVTTVALAAVFASTTAAGPPSSLGTITIKPLPKPGKAAFFTVTASGPLQPGVTKLTVPLYLELATSSHVTGNMQVAYVERKPVISGGIATISFLVAANNPTVGKFKRSVQSGTDGDALDMIVIGASGEWTPKVSESTDPCAKFKKQFREWARYYIDGSNFWLSKSRSTTGTQLITAALNAATRYAPC
jgi:hypothetical protein